MTDNFCYAKGKGFFWFRVFGVGFQIADRTIHPALFSERNGLKKHFRVWKYSTQYLPRIKKGPVEEPRFKVSELAPSDSPVYDFSIEQHLNNYQTQDGVKMRLVQILPIKGEDGFRVVWEKQL